MTILKDLFEWFGEIGQWKYQIIVTQIADSDEDDNGLIYEAMLTDPTGNTKAEDFGESYDDAANSLMRMVKEIRDYGELDPPRRFPDMVIREYFEGASTGLDHQ